MAKKKAAPVSNAKATTFLRRLTTKLIIGKVDKPDDEVELYRIYGVAKSHDMKESTYGPSTRFLGDFEATRTEDGKVFRAPTCYLPQPMSDMLKLALDQRGADDKGEVHGIKFAAVVSVVPATGEKPSQTGYEYRVSPVTEPEQAGEIADLRSKALEFRA